MKETIEQAKSSFLQAKNRFAHSVATTPDDRMTWSPSPSARNPVQIAAHVAGAIEDIHQMLDGATMTIATPEEAEAFFREREKAYSSRDEVLALIEAKSDNYVAFLDALTEDQLNSMVTLPFGMGAAPMSIALTFSPMHINWHTAQLDYVQTIYGDLDWHMSS